MCTVVRAPDPSATTTIEPLIPSPTPPVEPPSPASSERIPSSGITIELQPDPPVPSSVFSVVVRGLTPGDLVEISIGTSAADTERRAISQVDGSGSAQAQLLAPAARPQPWQVTVVRLGLARIRPVLATFAVRLAAAAVPASQVDLGYVAPRWFVDGMGEFAAYDALLSERMITADLVARYLEDSRANKPVPLRTLEGPSWPAEGNPYGLAHAAVARLAMTSGTSGLASFCSAIGTGAGWQQAFQKAFATGVPDFYSAFDRWTGSGRWD